MSQIYFEGKVRYEKLLENGFNKKVTEPYLVDALSFTEAENRIIEEVSAFISGEFQVSGIKITRFSEVVPSDQEDACIWYKVRLAFITVDEKSGAEKHTLTDLLVQAADLKDAVSRTDTHMKGTMADYRFVAVTETSIMDVFPYDASQDNPAPFEDYEQISEAARVCKSMAIGKERAIGSTPIDILDTKYGVGSGIRLIRQLIALGVVIRENGRLRFTERLLQSFEWYIPKTEKES